MPALDVLLNAVMMYLATVSAAGVHPRDAFVGVLSTLFASVDDAADAEV